MTERPTGTKQPGLSHKRVVVITRLTQGVGAAVV